MSSETWSWVINVLSDYWFLIILNILLLLTLFISVGFFLWIPKFIGSIFIWSFLWMSIALFHNNNTFFSASPSWEINNYLLDSLWQIIKAIWNALYLILDDASFIHEISLWQWLDVPDTTDLGHMGATLLITLLWTSKKSSGLEKSLVKDSSDNVSKHDNMSPNYSKQLNRSASNGPVDYRALVDASSVQSLTDNILGEYTGGNSSDLLRAAAMFEYVKNNVTYLSDDIQYGDDYVATPKQTLKAKKGDCDDQAVLMASLFSAANIKNRMLLISNISNEWHLVTEICIEFGMKEMFVDLLNEFYENSSRSLISKEYYFFEEQDGIWLLADTTRNHVADFESLIAEGYLYKTNSEIKWHNVESIY